jgi:gluconate 5-dehydrogenase
MSGDTANRFSLAGKTAIVTGASRGIGAALADGLAGAGAGVTGLARSATPDKPFLHRVRYLSQDVTAGIENICAAIGTESGQLDILINAAGISLPGAEKFAETIQTNLLAVHAACEAARPHMRAGGSIINITSIASVLGLPGNPAYNAAKGGLRMLTKSLAVDYGSAGIRVNALAPGYIRTAMTEASYQDSDRQNTRCRHTCLGRWGDVEDLIGSAIFLASDAAAYVTGIDLFVDGGWTAKGLVA